MHLQTATTNNANNIIYCQSTLLSCCTQVADEPRELHQVDEDAVSKQRKLQKKRTAYNAPTLPTGRKLRCNGINSPCHSRPCAHSLHVYATEYLTVRCLNSGGVVLQLTIEAESTLGEDNFARKIRVWKINKMPEFFCMIFAPKNTKIPEFYIVNS